MKRVFILSILILCMTFCVVSVSAEVVKMLSYNIKGV